MRDHEHFEALEEIDLSAEGAARRDEILSALLRQAPIAATRRRRRRSALRGAGSALALALGMAVWTQWPTRAHLGGTPGPGQSANPIASGGVERVQTDPSIVARLAASTDGAAIERISDDDLLRTLSAIGKPVGLIRDGDRMALTADVTTKPKGPGASAI